MTKRPRPIVIAHRGASGYLPEHTIASKVAAHTMGADFLEQDVVLTKDGIPIVMHDIYLDYTTDVALVFPNRCRGDGHFYALDFELNEIKQLSAHERVIASPNPSNALAFNNRFPSAKGLFKVPTLNEEITIISGLNQSRGKTVGIYLELKSPEFHLEAGYNIADIVINELMQTEYRVGGAPAYIQCFDDSTLKYLKFDLNTGYPLIQLLGENSWNDGSRTDYEKLKSWQGLKSVSTYAAGIGPWINQIFLGCDETKKPIASSIVSMARELNLLIHPYTFRQDELPQEMETFEELLRFFIVDQNVDGIFTDFPDVAINFINKYQ